MNQKYTALLIAAVLSLLSPTRMAGKNFSIIVDSETYKACKEEIETYRKILQNEGLQAYIADRDWKNPQQVKEELLSVYKSRGLVGAIFIGQIPVPMIRDAQHFTSAFKMDQERFPYRTSSVPSDRFYDDFDLKFDYLSQDSVNSLFHYFSLRWDSPQKIECDIYSGRLKPTRKGEEGHRQIRDYFRKLFAERAKGNKLDVIVSYTGEGSYSNSLTAWKEEGITMREQFPQAFVSRSSAKFLIFSMYPYMKETLTKELRREDVDLMLFHEHGDFNRQYITGIPESQGISENAEAAKRLFRNKLRREVENKRDTEKLKQEWMNYYKIDSSWFAGVTDPDQIKKDSLDDAATGIVLADVPGIAPNPRVVIFDACFNGDFREESFIAGEYIFSKGKTLVAIGNSVNVLQDKSAGDLLGLLGMGFRVGEWAQLTNILESHVIGDPTLCFSPTGNVSEINLHSTDCNYWLKVLKKESFPDLKGLALYKLFTLKYPGLPKLLTETYRSSDSYMLRLQVFHLLQFYNGPDFGELLKTSVYDPYEFIRRKSVYAMGRIGKDEFIPYVASVYLNDFLDERVKFNAEFCFDLMDPDKLEKEVLSQIQNSSSLFNKEKRTADFKKRMEFSGRVAQTSTEIADPAVKMSSRLFGVSTLRNNCYHTRVDEFLIVLKDNNQDINLRIKLAEALGWFTLSYRKADIILACKNLAAETDQNQKLKYELLKTVNRLEIYMR